MIRQFKIWSHNVAQWFMYISSFFLNRNEQDDKFALTTITSLANVF